MNELTGLAEEWSWRGRRIRWERLGSGPDLIFCHGTPWSSQLWRAQAEALSGQFTVYLWDMPGYGQSSKLADHRVSLDVQGELLADLIAYWEIDAPHVVAHDYGGAVALRAHLLHETPLASLTLVDVVALAPWGTGFFRLVREHADVFNALPAAIHAGLVEAYVRSASHTGLTPAQLDTLVAPWTRADGEGQAAFYRQISEADQRYTDDVEPLYSQLRLPVLVIWGTQDSWIPVDHAHRLAGLIPDAALHLIEDAGHLVPFDQPERLAVALHEWLTRQT